MMAAYNPTPGGGHPGLPHGHPGMGPNPGQHMGQPMQMHPGVSGAPHVSQAGAVMGMQPGAQMAHAGMGGQHPGGMMQAQMGGQSMPGGMPNAQAVNHMTPQQQQQHMQQQAALAAQLQGNPALMQQQHMLRLRQQQMIAQQQQAAQQNGMMNMHGANMGSLNPQQLAQIRHQQQQAAAMQNGGQPVQLPHHLQQAQMAVHQQQQSMQAQAQQQQQQHMAQQLAMQQANSQQSNQGQSAPQGQQSTPQQMRPQSRMANPSEQTPNQPQQNAQQTQAQQGQQNQQQGQQQGQQGQQANPQPNAQQVQQQKMAQFAMLQRVQRNQVLSQAQGGQGGMFILRLMNFSDHLSNFDENTGKNIMQWHNLVERHFAPEGRLVHGIDINHPSSGGRPKVYEVLRPSIARYFLTYFEAGATSIRLHTEHARELPHPSGSHQVTCQHAVFSVTYPNGIRLEMLGSLHVLFSAGTDNIECLQFQTLNTEEVLTRSQIEKVLSEFSPSLPNKASPKMAKNKLPKAQQKMQEQQERLTMDHFPKTSKGTYGITSRVQHFLEIGETMNVMSDLMWYAQEKKLRPEQAMEALAAQYDSQGNGQGGNPQINLPPNGVPPGQRTPSMGNMPMPQNGQGGSFSSPGVSNLNLPMQANGMNGSPHMGNNPGNLAPNNMNMPNSHTPSPHQGNMAAPQMVPQHSQQGTNSSVASASTSPNINNSNKRRRSTVKLEGDDGGGADGNTTNNNANRVKPSPRMAKKAKP